MNQKKLKDAFSKIKEDINSLVLDVNVIKARNKKYDKAMDLNSEVKSEIDKLKNLNIDNLILTLDKEINNIHKFIETINGRTADVNRAIEDLKSKLDVHNVKFEDFKKKFNETQKDTQNVSLDLKQLSEHTAEFEALIDEKVSLENGSMKLEFDSNLAKLASDLSKVSMELEKVKEAKHSSSNVSLTSNDFEEFSEMINEKVSMEIAAAKLEMQEEMIKFLSQNQIEEPKVKKVSLSREPDKKVERSRSNDSSTKVSQKPAKEGKIKKAVKWLFVDEEDDETSMSNIKNTIENKK